MDRKYNLRLDLQFRCNNSVMKFRQSDNNTSDFFMQITRAGELFDVENAIAILAVIKPNGSVQSQFLEIKEGKVYADLNNSMKDQVGVYKAQALLIMENERVSTDIIEYEVTEDNILSQLEAAVNSTEDFAMLQEILSRLSTIELKEEQREINEAERILSEDTRQANERLRIEAELFRVHEDADRAKYEATRQTNEDIRVKNEIARQEAEKVRSSEEAKRVEAETSREQAEQNRVNNYNFMTEDEERRRLEANSHKEAELLRVEAEKNRVNEEAKRRTVEAARVKAEDTREKQEATRVANEAARVKEHSTRLQDVANAISRIDNKVTEVNQFKSDIEKSVDSKITEVNQAKEGIITTVDNKIAEVNQVKENIVTTVDNKITEVNQAKTDMQTSVNNVISEANAKIEEIKDYNARIAQNEIKNIEQDNRLTSIEAVNRRQDILNNALLNENSDKRITLEEDNHNISLDYARDGVLEVNKLEGETLVNVCNQKDPVAITKSYTVENTNHVALQGEFDGKCRPVVQGNTLVNLCPSSFSWGVQSNGMTINMHQKINDLLKINTTYTIVLINKNPINVINKVYLNGKTFKDSLIGTVTLGDFITEAPVGNGMVHFYTSEPITQEYANNVYPMIFEGDLTANPPQYFEGLKSSFEDGLITDEKDPNYGKYKVDYKVTGKNKLKWIPNKSIGASTGIIGDSALAGLYFAKIGGLNNSRLSLNGIDTNVINTDDIDCAVYLDKNMNYIGVHYKPIYYSNRPSNACYVYFRNTDNVQLNYQLEEGTTATPYEPYKEYTKTFYLNSPLLEGDTIEDVNGKATHVHRYKQEIFDGSDDETIIDRLADGTTSDNGVNAFFTIKTANSYKCPSGGFPTTMGITKIVSAIANAYTSGVGIYHYYSASNNNGTGSTIYVVMPKAMLSSADLTGFKAYLQANPLTVVYPLASPTYETISEESILCDSYVDGHLDFDSAVPVEKVVFNYVGLANKYLYPSTAYTVQFESDSIGKLDKLVLGSTEFCVNYTVSKGLNTVKGVTNAILPHNNLTLYGIGFNASNISVVPTERNFDYFEGMKSSFEDKVNEDGKYEVKVKVTNEEGKESVSTILLNSPLLKGDEIKVVDGKLCHVHNYNSIVLDGSENWVHPAWSKSDSWLANNPNGYAYETTLASNLAVGSINTGVSDKFSMRAILNSSGVKLGEVVILSQYICFATTINSISSWKTWLQQNSTTVVYQLANPIIEPLTPQLPNWVLECFENGTFAVDTGLPVSSKITYTGQIPSVKGIVKTNEEQDELINISLCATDEMFMMIEPILEAMPQVVNNERMVSKMVDMYVAMIQRGLKTIEEVPLRYREEVRKIIEQLEK